MVLNILCATYFMTSLTIPDRQTMSCASHMRQATWCRRSLWHQLALASC